MEVLSFNLSGKFAFFKNESINNIYDTYPHIHKPALLGLFGAILGYDGYAQTQKFFDRKDNIYPEYYKKLKDLKIAIVPKKANFSKILETFTNNTGMFNKEGASLVTQEFWLENPNWDIYLVIDDEESKKIKDSILNSKSVYSIYLGSNHHFANISNIGIFEARELKFSADVIHSLIKVEDVDINFNNMLTARKENKNLYYFNYTLPTVLTENTNLYEKEKFILTNDLLYFKKFKGLYKVNDINVVFY